MLAVIIRHKVKLGRRADVEAIWRAHMLPAVSANDGHVFYAYCFGTGEEEISAFQLYKSANDAARFVGSPEYEAYNIAVGPLLEAQPEVIILEPRWTKPSLEEGQKAAQA